MSLEAIRGEIFIVSCSLRQLAQGTFHHTAILHTVSAVAVSENANEISVTIVQTTSSDSDDVNTVITITPVDDTSGDDTPVDDTPVDDTPVDDTPVDDTPVDGSSGPTISDFQLDGSSWEGYADEMSKWILSTLDNDPLSSIGDFPQGVTYTINFE